MDLVFAPSQIETWPLDRLRPYALNAKIHGTDQVAKIAASMAKFGWTVPCMVADDGELIAIDDPHDFAYAADAVRAAVTLLDAPDGLHMPCATTHTPRQILRIGADAIGVPVKTFALPL